MSHPDLIIAAELHKETDPVRALGDYVVNRLREKHNDHDQWGDLDYELVEVAERLGLIPKE